jgi:hypothetical protein
MFAKCCPALALLAFALAGCNDKPASVAQKAASPGAASSGPAPSLPADEVAAERAKLSPEDRALVEAQEWCVMQEDERLGSMGPPIKLEVKGKTVFVCCGGCKKEALANPDATLAKLEALKAKKAAMKR